MKEIKMQSISQIKIEGIKVAYNPTSDEVGFATFYNDDQNNFDERPAHLCWVKRINAIAIILQILSQKYEQERS